MGREQDLAKAFADLADAVGRWPALAPVALSEGFRAVHAFPMRLRNNVIGALNLFSTHTGDLPDDDRHVAQALADVATIGLLQERAIHNNDVLVAQLEGALASRILIEQAKGVIAEQLDLDMDTAFRLILKRARDSNSRLADVARDVVGGRISIRSQGHSAVRDT